MDQQRWAMIREVFDAALELPSSQRDAYIRQASQGDLETYSTLQDLLLADQDAGSFLESPLLAATAFQQPTAGQPLQTGEVLCDRFRIVRPLGEGGMGHVFEAWDIELRRSVALKAIRPEIAAHTESLKRFRQEVSLALRITHPNVCRTFDIERATRVVDAATGTTQELLFLTMEFLEGETLAARLARSGPLSLDEALRIARQLADALTCAHELGIYHRDIKPANIMLVPSAAPPPPVATGATGKATAAPRAVITDFGLARQEALQRADGLSGVSSSGIPIGTFAYMAPEQLECAETSAATDIYAFGLVLFEMVTGKRAFPSSNPLSGIKQRLTGSAPSPRSLVPSLPDSWCKAIEGCLRAIPAERLQHIEDVIAILDGEHVSLPPTRPRRPVDQPTRLSRWTLPQWPAQYRLLGLLALFLAAVSLFWGGQRLYQSKAVPPVEPGALVYLTQVKNQTGEKAFDNLTELIQAGLTQSAQINLLDQGRVGDILQQMTKSPNTVITEPIAREIAMRAGAPRVVFATVTGTNGSYKLNIDIQWPDATTPNRYRDNWTNSFEWHTSGSTSNQDTIPQELLRAIRKSSDWIRREAGESQNDIARLDAPPEDVTTASWKALADYAHAEHLAANGKQEEAVVALRTAVAIDPEFALAYGRMGDLLDSMRRSSEGYAAYKQALSVNMQNRLTHREFDRIRGMFSLDTGDEQTAEAAFRDYAVYYEHDYAGWFFRAYPLVMLGRNEEAIDTLVKAYAIDPKRLSAPAHLARFYLLKGDIQSAWNWQRWLNTNGFTEDAEFAAGQIDLFEEKYDEAERSFQAMLASKDTSYQSIAWSLLARFYAERGDYSKALDMLNTGIVLDSSQGFIAQRSAKLIDRADIHCRLADNSTVISDIHEAVKEEPGLQSIVAAASALGRCRVLAQGKLDGPTLRELALLDQSVPQEQEESILSSVTKLKIRGELLLAEGKWRDGIKLLERADRLEAPKENRDYLARAYLIASIKESNTGTRLRYQQKSFEIFAKITRDRALLWYLMLVLPPGNYGDTLACYLHLGIGLNKVDKTLQQPLAAFAQLRDHQFQSSPDLVNALNRQNDSGKSSLIQKQGD